MPQFVIIRVNSWANLFDKGAPGVKVKISPGTNSFLKQLGRYLDRLGLKQGYLVIFDPGPAEWEEKLYYQEIPLGDKKITMVGL